MKIFKSFKKKFHCDTRPFPFIVSSGYVSNGQFALKEDYLEVGYRASLKAQVGNNHQPDLSRIIPDPSDYKECVISGFLFEFDDGFKRILYNNDCFVALNEDYVSLFNCDTVNFLIRDMYNPVIGVNKFDSTSIDVVIMPMIVKSKDFDQIAEILQLTNTRRQEAVA